MPTVCNCFSGCYLFCQQVRPKSVNRRCEAEVRFVHKSLKHKASQDRANMLRRMALLLWQDIISKSRKSLSTRVECVVLRKCTCNSSLEKGKQKTCTLTAYLRRIEGSFEAGSGEGLTGTSLLMNRGAPIMPALKRA